MNNSRISHLIRRMQNAPDFGYDDESVELSAILATEGKAWLWGPGDKVQIVTQAEYDVLEAAAKAAK